MQWEKLLKITKNQAVFRTEILLVGGQNPKVISKQLCRWVERGKLLKVRRGWYSVSQTYQQEVVDPFYLATTVKPASYISLQSALYFYGLIPEFVPTVTSITTGRPEKLSCSLATVIYRHLKTSLFWGFKEKKITNHQTTVIATPEKALCDLLYLTQHSASLNFICELRLQHTSLINESVLHDTAKNFNSRKVLKGVEFILREKKKDEEYVIL